MSLAPQPTFFATFLSQKNDISRRMVEQKHITDGHLAKERGVLLEYQSSECKGLIPLGL
jgi:hypothetical protein